jgi:uncharacterized membrane protein YidH (DUF202 family)
VAKGDSLKIQPAVEAQRGAEGVVRSSGFEWFARSGFIARGLVYGIIGVLAVKLALGDGGKATNQQGALRTIAHQPFGKVLLVLVAAGLAGYALWRFTRAALGHGPEASDSGFDRAAAFASGVVYAALCVIAVKIIIGAGSGGSGDTQKATGGVLGWPGGQWLVGFGGAVLIGVGVYQGYQGITKKFLEDSKTERMGREVKRWITVLGVFGHLARMVVFWLVGVFLVKAAADYSSRKAVGLDGALAKLVHQSYGPFLLGVVATGLIAFALYSLSDARYRRI